MPTDRSPDSTLALLTEGYEFVSKRCERYSSDVFATRLRFEPTICMRGEEAARVFYDPDRFTRVDAAPDRLSNTLFGEGGVQGLDGAEHQARKLLFMSLMTRERIDRLVGLTGAEWRRAVDGWSERPQVVLFTGVTQLLMRSVCAWAGIPLPESEVGRRTADVAAMIDAAGSVGPRYVRGRLGRLRSNRWAEGLIRDVRTGRLTVPGGSALARIAEHRDLDGRLLDTHSAAVDLLNVIRPTVAVARYVVFIAMALQRHPASLAHLRAAPDDDRYLEWFVQEVRRSYPFFPFVAARVRRDFTWRGNHFREGTRVLLDLYGTNHHPDVWRDPECFRPERFASRDGGAYDFVPQGGGDHFTNHRCAGEWITIALMRQATRVLVGDLHYEVPAQDLRIRMSRVPAIPRSRFVISRVCVAG